MSNARLGDRGRIPGVMNTHNFMSRFLKLDDRGRIPGTAFPPPPEGDVYFFDGGKSGASDTVSKYFVNDKGRFTSVCQREGLMRRVTHVIYAESTMRQRRTRVGGVGSMRQLKSLHAYAAKETHFPEQDRVKYSGTNVGDCIGEVVLDTWEDSWKLSMADKKLLYGSNRRAVGGRSERLINKCVKVDRGRYLTWLVLPIPFDQT